MFVLEYFYLCKRNKLKKNKYKMNTKYMVIKETLLFTCLQTLFSAVQNKQNKSFV